MSIWDYRKNFAFDDPLNPGDARLADLNQARGDYNRARLLREFGVDIANNCLRAAPVGKYVLFGGHRGCGKSTELREIAAQLQGRTRYFVVQIDVTKGLDVNNLTYADVALALAEKLAQDAAAAGIDVPAVFLTPLHEWFKQVSHHTAMEKGESAEVKAELEAGGGLPFIGKLLAKLTTAIRTNTTYKTEIRESVRNTFTTFSSIFNSLLNYIREKVIEAGLGKSIIIVIDGTDRLTGEEADALFIRDIHQLRAIQANCIYCAPISVLNEHGQVAQNFDAVFRLPMVKLGEKGRDNNPTQGIASAWSQMRDFVAKRLPAENFDSLDTLDLLIGYSGGHPRDLLRLINLCFQEIDEGPINRNVAETAMRRLSADYRRLVRSEDWSLLLEIDRGATSYTPATEQTRRLLYDLVLLEYNSYWWQSHPAVRALPDYQQQKPKSAVT